MKLKMWIKWLFCDCTYNTIYLAPYEDEEGQVYGIQECEKCHIRRIICLGKKERRWD